MHIHSPTVWLWLNDTISYPLPLIITHQRKQITNSLITKSRCWYYWEGGFWELGFRNCDYDMWPSFFFVIFLTLKVFSTSEDICYLFSNIFTDSTNDKYNPCKLASMRKSSPNLGSSCRILSQIPGSRPKSYHGNLLPPPPHAE